MGFMFYARLAEAAAGLVTANPALLVDGLTGAAKSWVTGQLLDSDLLAPVVEPVKDLVGETFDDVEWSDIADTSAFW